ncbi:ribosomal-processing cysteine protease Prp [Candidatus Ventrimonas sp.]|uniref:ribosomal-processing cysteine protease Prp n=1 Tax=Candidatus Ventrimonas sp. TaxID=3048889 RepID=UPI003AB109A3
MTNIVINIGPDTMKLSMEGHACYQMDGNDVVCSAASAMGQALVDAMFHTPDIRAVAKLERGNLFLKAHYREEQKGLIKNRMAVAMSGFRMLQEAYPENVSYTCQEG